MFCTLKTKLKINLVFLQSHNLIMVHDNLDCDNQNYKPFL